LLEAGEVSLKRLDYWQRHRLLQSLGYSRQHRGCFKALGLLAAAQGCFKALGLLAAAQGCFKALGLLAAAQGYFKALGLLAAAQGYFKALGLLALAQVPRGPEVAWAEACCRCLVARFGYRERQCEGEHVGFGLHRTTAEGLSQR